VRRNVRTFKAGDPFVVLYAGQINYHKGVHVLLDAFTRLKAKNASLRLYGSGPDGATRNFKEMVKSDRRVEFRGVYKEHEIGEIFSAADVVVIPSNWHENNTIVMREALASHVPCVVSNAGGMIEKIQDGVNGFVFRMGDADHLKEILERILEQPGILGELRKNLHTYALTTVEQEAFSYQAEYQRLTQ
jgi:glycosyltransferase involved in cell wall biosynthesis